MLSSARRCQTSLFDHLMFFLSLFLVSVETFLILQSQFWREKTQELVQIFLGKTHYSPLIYMQSWHGAVKLLSIHSCRGEEENTSGCGHSSVLPSQPRVCLTLCSPQQVFVCQVQPGSPGWVPQHHCHEKYQAAPPRVYLAVNTLHIAGCLLASAAHKDSVCVWCVVLISCHSRPHQNQCS